MPYVVSFYLKQFIEFNDYKEGLVWSGEEGKSLLVVWTYGDSVERKYIPLK